MKKILFAVVFLITSGACGRLGTVEHSGVVDAKISLDPTLINYYFRKSCCKASLLATSPGFNPTSPAGLASIQNCTDNPTTQITQCSEGYTADFLTEMTLLIQPTPVPVN